MATVYGSNGMAEKNVRTQKIGAYSEKKQDGASTGVPHPNIVPLW